MNKGKIHYRNRAFITELVDCGEKRTPIRSTHIEEMVNCERCKRTKLFKHHKGFMN